MKQDSLFGGDAGESARSAGPVLVLIGLAAGGWLKSKSTHYKALLRMMKLPE